MMTSDIPWRPKEGNTASPEETVLTTTSPKSKSSPSSDQGGQDADQVARQRRTRASNAKVRTGCVTCKKRHVKCDEAKPFCLNCLKLTGHCEGYQVKPRKPRSKPVPKAAKAAADTELIRAGSPVMFMDPDVNSLDFSNELQCLYFNEFVHFATTSFGGSFSYNNLWGTTLPQVSRTNETLRHAAIAIGALNRAYITTKRRDMQNVPTTRYGIMRLKEDSPHYHNAIVHYCAALRLQAQATSQAVVIQNTILLSLLFICFELTRGDRASAIRHINHGMALMYALVTGDGLQSRYDISRASANPHGLISDVVTTYASLAFQTRTVLSGRLGSELPLPEVTKGLFERGLTVDEFIVTLHQSFGPKFTATMDTMPEFFRTLDEVEEYMQVLHIWAAQTGQSLLHFLLESPMLELEDDEEINREMAEFLQIPEVISVCDNIVQRTRQLSKAFQPIFNVLMMDDTTSKREFVRALHMRLNVLFLETFNSFTRFASYDDMESLTPLCREICTLAERMLRTLHDQMDGLAPTMSLDIGVSWHLWLVSIHCRDPLVRDDAIRLLTDYPRADGLWDSRAFREVGLRNQHIERNNSTEGTMNQQWMRLWRREAVLEDAGRRVLFRFMDKNPDTGKWGVVEEVADLGPDENAEVVWKRQPLTGRGGKFIFSSLIMNPLKKQEQSQQEESASSAEPEREL